MSARARILVVDDEPKICLMLQAALRRQGYRVETCGDGTAALEQFRAEPYEVLISDIRMPGVGGFDLIRQVKDSYPGTVVVAITGHATVDTAVQALQTGADDYVPKPFDINGLRRVIEISRRSQQILRRSARPAAHEPAVAAADAPGDREPQAAAAPAALAEGEPQPIAPPPLPQGEPQPIAPPVPPAPEQSRIGNRQSQMPPSPARDLLEANRQLEARVGELQTAQEIAQAITAELDLDRLLETCLAKVAPVVGARAASVLLADPARGSLVVRGRHGRDRRYLLGERRAVGEGIAGWVAEHRVPLLIPSVDEQPSFQELARSDGYASGSFVAVPLLLGDRLVGVLSATDKADGSAFDERDLRFLIGVAGQAAVAIENARVCEGLKARSFTALRALTEALESRDAYLHGHASRVAGYATRTAQELGLANEEIRTLAHAAQVHDIGRVALSDAAMGRAGPLTDAERTALHQHPLRGEQIVKSLGFLDSARPLIRHHHERWDGQGYPDGLQGREIDPLTRVLTIADAFDAMTSPRPHRPAMSREEALGEMASNVKTQFDPGLVEPFGRAVVALA